MTTTVVKQAYQTDDVALSYDRERFASLAGWLFDTLEKRTFRGVLRRVVDELATCRVLDVPCGTGRITEVLADAGLDVVGGDISEQMIGVARRKLERFGEAVSFRRLDLDGLDLPNDSFDVVSCIRLFHHLTTEERTPILKEIARVSRRFVMINVSYSSPYYRLRRRVKRALGQGVSRTSSTWQEIHDEASQAGLRVRRIDFVLPGLSEDAIVLLEKKE